MVRTHIAILGIWVPQFWEQCCNPKCIEIPHIYWRYPPSKREITKNGKFNL